jgi:hypothetical protein
MSAQAHTVAPVARAADERGECWRCASSCISSR